MLGGPLRKCRIKTLLLLFFALILLVLWTQTAPTEEKLLAKTSKKIYININGRNQEEYVDRNGIKVVVGHYIGPSLRKVPNATLDMLNGNNFRPDPAAGRMGQPVVIPPKDLLQMQQLYQINRFNLMASDRIPLNRTLPDVRRKKCKYLFGDYETYPKSSIVIVFHNEAWSTLFRTVWSVIGRTPRELLQEIILVDDASERDFLKAPLDDYIKTLPVTVKVLRNKERIGLIRARMQGAKTAQAPILVFLDAHCECTQGWLEPLINPIKKDQKTVVCPVIDIINDDTFAYVKSFELHWGALNWNLQFRWFTLGPHALKKRNGNVLEPFGTPAMAGGLFAISKDYFFHLGAYDEDMKIWGGENLELSFRVWQCGGQVLIAPCSHVGHLFRKSSPYTFPGGITNTLFRNLARVALVWLDEWSDFYFKFNEESASLRKDIDVRARKLLRQRLKCKDFAWYLREIWPQNFFPNYDRFFGRIKNLEEGLCLTKPVGNVNSNQPVGLAKINQCLEKDMSFEMFVMTKEGFIMTDDSICLDAPEKEKKSVKKVRIMACSSSSRQKWKYDKATKEIRHLTNDLCLDVAASKEFNDGLVINDCSGAMSQKWQLIDVPWTNLTSVK